MVSEIKSFVEVTSVHKWPKRHDNFFVAVVLHVLYIYIYIIYHTWKNFRNNGNQNYILADKANFPLILG